MGKKAGQQKKWLRFRVGRRISQVLFLTIFLFLIFATVGLTGAGFDAENSAAVPYPVEAFLDVNPLAMVTVFLSTFSVPKTLLWSLIVLASAVFFGRAFCSWVCPMGTLNHAVSETKPSLTKKQKRSRNQVKPAHKIKYLLLISLLVSALFGSAIVGVFDPISMVTRGIALTVLPIANYLVSEFIERTAASGSQSIQQLSDAVYGAAHGFVVHQGGLITASGTLLSLFFIAVLVANRFVPRFWCRYACPLGALLGLTGRFSLLSLKKDEDKCTQCGKCEQFCSGAASPMPGTNWERAECDVCMNCVAVCPEDALQFGLAGWAGLTENDGPDLRKRQLIGSALAGAVIVPIARTTTISSPGGRPDPACIRPPGAVAEESFLERCIRCGQCMKICPNNALHPALDEAGVEGLWTPILVPKVGYCEPTCTLCTQVCPTAAIKRVHEKQKTGASSKGAMVRIGTAFIQRGRCLPWAMGTPCTVCEEFCPVSPKAIRLERVTEQVNGTSVTLLRPYIDPALCTGCGACEYVCPVHDEAAVIVTSAGETRSKQNKLLL
ncbi:MAG: 4Fe-4S binding protein [Deltaproteobacteria bacterium]|nr:4Fe-4S binding protein [Deltaproteobacteria bacterium]MBN2670068.1 4Fe-4S binding protein [Deltaproteobacteria bacterium]